MRLFLFILAILAFLVGVGIFASDKSVIHEIEAFSLFIISIIAFSGAGIIESINLLRGEIKIFMKQKG